MNDRNVSHDPQGELATSRRIARAIGDLYDVYTPEGIGVWLAGAKRSFDGLSPLQALAMGRVQDFEYAVERLRTGAM